MRRPIFFASVLWLAAALSADAATGRVLKVLPHFLDLKGRHTVSPSLYDRDAYQMFLRTHPDQRSGVRFDVQWKAHGESAAPVKVRVELRGIAKNDLPRQLVLEQEVRPAWFSHWLSLPLTGDAYKNFGDVTAWRATLWEGDRLLSEQKSFLW